MVTQLIEKGIDFETIAIVMNDTFQTSCFTDSCIRLWFDNNGTNKYPFTQDEAK